MLVVDDNADSRELLMVLLEGYGAEVIAVTSVSESLEMMQRGYPDLLISELALPDEDGYSLMSKVKTLEAEHCVQIPAIALTVLANDDARSQALTAGFCRYMTKPFNIDELIKTVACLTEQAQAVAISP